MMPTAETLIDIGRRAGLAAVGVCRGGAVHRHGNDPAGAQGRRAPRRDAVHLPKAGAFHRSVAHPAGTPRRWWWAPSISTRGEPEHPDDGLPYARVAAYAREDHYSALRSALQQVAEALRAAGYRAGWVVADDNALVDRAAAYRAGIGWWGKSSNILVPGAGSMVVGWARW